MALLIQYMKNLRYQGQELDTTIETHLRALIGQVPEVCQEG